MDWKQLLLLFVAAMLAGAVNAVAGGGTLLTFPALLAVGTLAKIANATSTVALWPGQLSSLWGYRREIGENQDAIGRLAIPSLLGGILGAMLLLRTPAGLFANLVPYLILMATLLFMAQEPLSRWQRARSAAAAGPGGPAESADKNRDEISARGWAGVMVFQFFVAVYGGYFGAGIGILMLAALGLMGFRNIHRMNGLKNINGLCINLVAAVIFIANGLVQWPIALWMATGAIVGGYGGAGIARKIGQKNVRRIIIVIGFGLTLSLLIKREAGVRSAPPLHGAPRMGANHTG
ncbi:MAG TPA: sulfite exporter TauE/SafE family protein [Chthonomonadaceae bacterium]|nr:sulfite exporter TauE/SafE family protein [Chthonomonadaceae bacterium]